MFQSAMFRTLFVVALATLGVGCRKGDGSRGSTLTVFVAASLADVTREIGREFTESTGVAVDLSIAASGILRRQIEAGAPCDLFIAAHRIDMDLLAKKQGIDESSRRVLASNQLVIVAEPGSKPLDSAKRLVESEQKVAIGDPRYVPAGRYAEEALKQLELWDSLEGRLILADNVRVALQYVEFGQADAAIVYSTDAMTADCEVVYRFSATTTKIECHAATCARSLNKKYANAFLNALADRKHADIWNRHGFSPPEDK